MWEKFLTEHPNKSPLEFKLDFELEEIEPKNSVIGSFYLRDMAYVQYGYLLDKKIQNYLLSRLREELLLSTIVALTYMPGP